MRRIILAAFLLVFIFSGLQAQRRNGLIGHRTEQAGLLTFSVGPAYCFDDPYASEFNSSIFNGHDFQIALGFQHSIGEDGFGYRAQLHYLNFTGEDIPTAIGEDNKNRVHSMGFESYVANVFELTGRGEYSIEFGSKYRRAKPSTVYGFVGLGAFLSTATFPPVTGQDVYIGKLTPSFGIFIPFGVGYKYQLNSQISIGAEVAPQVVFSDYVDGYKGSHIPGVPVVNDNIGSLSFTFYYQLF